MDRRTSLKSLALGALIAKTDLSKISENNLFNRKEVKKDEKGFSGEEKPYQSHWQDMPDMTFLGEEFWGQRLQDWQIKNGRLVCNIAAPDRTMHLLTHQMTGKTGMLHTSVEIKFPPDENLFANPEIKNVAGFRLAARGRYPDYRSAVITGSGLDLGVSVDGKLFIGKDRNTGESIPVGQLHKGIRLDCKILNEDNGANSCILQAFDLKGSLLATQTQGLDPMDLTGNIALVCHFAAKRNQEKDMKEGISFSDWKVSGSRVSVYPSRIFGPIYFTQYTLHKEILRLTAQLAPMDIEGARAVLEFKESNHWKEALAVPIDPIARIANFTVKGWEKKEDTPYRVRYELPLLSGKKRVYDYEGTVAKEPIKKDQLKALVFSCNWDLGFPDQEVLDNAQKHDADVMIFLGDQYYEPNGGFGIQTSPPEKSYLDLLRKWYQFGWSYRELFRHKPTICIPDDHDVYQGNLWGSDGKNTIHTGTKADIQDSGGYFMPSAWVNLVMSTQTSHMPAPYDPEPVQRGIHVFYTTWDYAGISFAIIEDRKWKSSPSNELPKIAKVWNGFPENQQFNVKTYIDPKTAGLLGERQLQFLEEWGKDWSNHAQMKIWVSATPFMCLQTFPKGINDDGQNDSLPIPEPGVYVQGDHLAEDMDSDGWPQNKRDKALKIIRKAFALQLTGDQHLAAVVHYGVDDYGDSGYTFVVPATCSIWPRRWWPPLPDGHQPLPGQPAYTGNFEDAFGNKITVHAVANPEKHGFVPAILYDRSTGYGVATFDKKMRTVRLECWPRNIDPLQNPGGQYLGWPVIVHQLDNYGRKAKGFLPQLSISKEDQVVQVINEVTSEIEYTVRIKGRLFTPKVFALTPHTIRIGDPDENKWQELKGVMPSETKKGIINVKLV